MGVYKFCRPLSWKFLSIVEVSFLQVSCLKRQLVFYNRWKYAGIGSNFQILRLFDDMFFSVHNYGSVSIPFRSNKKNRLVTALHLVLAPSQLRSHLNRVYGEPSFSGVPLTSQLEIGLSFWPKEEKYENNKLGRRICYLLLHSLLHSIEFLSLVCINCVLLTM